MKRCCLFIIALLMLITTIGCSNKSINESVSSNATPTATVKSTPEPTATMAPTPQQVNFNEYIDKFIVGSSKEGLYNINQLVGNYVYVPASEDILIDWFFFLPRNIKPDNPVNIYVPDITFSIDGDAMEEMKLMDGEFTNEKAQSYYEACVNHTKENMLRYFYWMSNENNYIILYPVIYTTGADLKAMGLDRRMYYAPERYNEKWLYPEKQLVSAFNILSTFLKDSGYTVNDKMYLEGFSFGGAFAQKFALVYPEMVAAIVAGQCGGTIALPITLIDDNELHWPLGTADFEEIFNKPFNEEAFKTIPQLIYIADGDLDTTIYSYDMYEDSFYYSENEINFYKNKFGENEPTRLENVVKYLNELGFSNIEFYTYQGVGHVAPDNRDEVIIDFFNEHDQS